jgi:ABC-type branched-subunit amino acid transport system substrate-binding protein
MHSDARDATSSPEWPLPRSSGRRLLGAMLLLGALTGCGDSEADEGGVAIGALVPFTGISAAGGANYERAMLLAIEYLNAQEALSGTHFRLAVRDSHTTSERTLGALRLVLDEHVVGLIGPDRVELVQDVRAKLGDHDLAHVLPSSMTLADFADTRTGLLIRPAPAAEFVGCALSNRIYADLNRRLVVIHSNDAYRKAFASAVASSFESYRFAAHVGEAFEVPLPDDPADYLDTVTTAASLKPDTVVVAADAAVGAGLVRAWGALTPTPVQWFFEPALRSEEFLRNVSPNTVAGATGISLALPDEAKEFDRTYRARWAGEPPLVESHLYFDAVIAIGLAQLAAAREHGRRPTPEEVSKGVLKIFRGPGQSVSWKELDRAVALIVEGMPIHYVGAAGRSILDQLGQTDGTAGLFQFWRIEQGRIVSERFGACGAGTIDTEGT